MWALGSWCRSWRVARACRFDIVGGRSVGFDNVVRVGDGGAGGLVAPSFVFVCVVCGVWCGVVCVRERERESEVKGVKYVLTEVKHQVLFRENL